MRKQGLGEFSTIGIWGASPGFYASPGEDEPEHDIFFFGVANRDLKTLQEAILQASFPLTTTRRAVKSLPALTSEKLRVAEPTETAEDLVAVLWKARVVAVPLHPGDLYPTGFTNVTEASLCGCAVVLADSTSIPKEALNGPGIFLYRAGNAASLLAAMEVALAASREEGFRVKVREWAGRILNGRKLEQDILEALEAGD
jgi:glycosyltransferase involved in cell wall biosynthesis